MNGGNRDKKKNFWYYFARTWWFFLGVIGILIAIFGSFDIGDKKYPSDGIEQFVERNYGYSSVREYVRDTYTVDDLFEKEEIMEVVIGYGWLDEYLPEEETATRTIPSSDFAASTQIVLPQVQQSQPVTRSNAGGNTVSEKQDVTVYITNTGSKYHKSGCQYLKESKIAISLSDAKARGYTACSKCY